MMRILSAWVLASFIVVGGAGAAAASGGDNLLSQKEFEARARRAEGLANRAERLKQHREKLEKLQKDRGYWHREGPAVNVPELDASAAASAITLLLGGALILADRRRGRLA